MVKFFRAVVAALRTPRCRNIAIRAFSSNRANTSGLSYWHEPGSEPLQYLTTGQLAERAAERYGDREALVSIEEGVRISFKDLLQQADEFAAGLRKLGLRPGDHVALWAPNTWKYAVGRLGLARAGLSSVDMNPLYREQEALHCLRLGRVAAVVAAEEHRGLRYHEILAAVAPEIPLGRGGAVRSKALPDLRNFITLADKPVPGAISFNELKQSASAEDIQAIRDSQRFVNPDSGCSIQFSSGTTGKPKAIALTHMGFINHSYGVGKRLRMDEKHHRVCVQVPFFHVFGTAFAFCASMHFGATLVLPTLGYDPKCSIHAIRTERCSMVAGTPTMHVDVVRLLEATGETLDSVEVVVTGGAPITPELVKRMMATIGNDRLCSLYGLSEMTAAAFQTMPTDTVDQMANTVGKVKDHVEAKVVDENGLLVPFGTPGELYLRGYGTMIEYYQDEEATRKTKVDGWVRTGDKFVLLEDGYGRVVGRLKDMIIRGGENIFPVEIEDFLSGHPDINEVQVIGVADERMGEEVCACIRVRGGGDLQLTAKQLREFCKGKIANFKIPRYTIIMQEFPKTLSGKIQKFKLREHCEALLNRNELSDAFAEQQEK